MNQTTWDFEQIKWIWSLLQWAVVMGCALFTYLSNRDSANQKDLQKLSERVRGLESRMENMPTASDVHAIAGDVKAIQTSIESLQKTNETLGRSVDRMTDFLLSKT